MIYAIPAALYAEGAVANDSIWTGNINVLLGSKSLDEDDLQPIEDHGAFGVFLDFRKKSWPVSIAIDSLGSGATEDVGPNKIEGTTREFDIGVRKIWEPAGMNIRPFIGGGLAFISAEQISRNGFNATLDDDTGIGLWFEGGVYWTLTEHFNIGLDLRFSGAEVELFNQDIQAGGATFGMLLGYHF
jgi:hypothetical protein